MNMFPSQTSQTKQKWQINVQLSHFTETTRHNQKDEENDVMVISGTAEIEIVRPTTF